MYISKGLDFFPTFSSLDAITDTLLTAFYPFMCKQEWGEAGGKAQWLGASECCSGLSLILIPQADLSLGARSHFTWILVLAVI